MHRWVIYLMCWVEDLCGRTSLEMYAPEDYVVMKNSILTESVVIVQEYYIDKRCVQLRRYADGPFSFVLWNFSSIDRNRNV
jgi:hypothetical protein